MTDIASLGLKVDATQVVSATSALDRLTASAKPAASAVTTLQSALTHFADDLKKASSAINDMSSVGQRSLDQLRARFSPLFAAQQEYKQRLNDIRDAQRLGALTQDEAGAAISRTKDAFANQVKAIQGGKVAFNQMSFEAKNLSYQLVDVTQGVLMGQSAFQIFAQQAGQIGQVIATSPQGLGGLLKEIGTSLRGLITPLTLAGAGVAALGVGAYAAYQSWKTFALQLDDTAHIAGTTSSAMAQLQAAASFKGISLDDFSKGAGNFSQQIYLAKQNMGGLIDVLRVNGVSAAGDFTTLLGKAADLIQNARSDQQRLVLLQQMGLPATMDWVRFLSQGSAGIKQATDEAVKFGGAANDNLVKKAREADQAWNTFWTNFGLKAKQYTVEAATGVTGFIAKIKQAQTDVQLRGTKLQGATPLGSNFDDFYKVTGADRPTNKSGSKDPNAVRTEISRAQQTLSLLGQTATATEQVRQFELQLQAARLDGIKIDTNRAQVLKDLIRDQALGVTQIKASIDSTRIEGDTIGMTAGQAAAYTAAQNALNDARRRGQVLGPSEIAYIRQTADALGEAAKRTDELRFGFDTFSGFFRDFGQNLRNGASLWDSFAKAGQNALGKIADRLMDMASRNLWNAAFGSAGGGGGFFSSLFGGSSLTASESGTLAATGVTGLHSGGLVGTDSTFVRATHPAYFDDAPRFHTGGMVSDEVPIIAKRGEGVFTPAQMRALAPVGKQGGAAPISITINQNNTFTNADPGSEARMRSALLQTKNQAVQEAVQAVAKVKSDNPSYLR